jgi:hypothetical protein
MASSLTGRTKKLTWADFGTPVPKPKPPPGGTATAAHTETLAPITYGWASSGKSVTLSDNVTVAIQFVASKSWVADWVFSESKQFQDDLLKHEQGHYDITALMARDMFIELMQLKGQTFANKAALDAAVAAVVKAHKFQPVHDKYDEKSETNHGMNDAQQKAWDALFQKAWTTPRSPAVTAPDGAVYKMRLLDVLKGAGKSP